MALRLVTEAVTEAKAGDKKMVNPVGNILPFYRKGS